MRRRTASCLLALAWVPIGAAAGSNGADDDKASRFAERSVQLALNFRQGDLQSLRDAEPLFTPEGWADFMRRLNGWLDAGGAPVFSSSFTASGPPILTTNSVSGGISFTVPGVLRHESRQPQGGKSATSYRAEIDVQLTAEPFKVAQLSQRTCGGAVTVARCR
ncbi:hypothetical protein J7U46_07430 [Pelomonas sp. V22]|uniref:hypothetical protein n=1 Tax=Pelomonas sp. V22 TaxID=2822139 RepID=UPI0024A883C3|nr:hypothetical protein [Pelomonas sp. V22]MDI4632876.1 hypothetical protein [Pelomonas sp. V22]